MILENIDLWARKKGIQVMGTGDFTGDFTHPAWFAKLKDKLLTDGDGLFGLVPGLRKKINENVPSTCTGDVHFILSVEISTIYKKGDLTRKVHHVVYVPSLDAAERFSKALARIGNISSDGRPILGLDAKKLLKIVLDWLNTQPPLFSSPSPLRPF
jgi:DNA helicase-2/ATP-dependent DNA helicase PcrA